MKKPKVTKPKVDLKGANSNIHDIASVAYHALRRNKQHEQADKIFDIVCGCTSYDFVIVKLSALVEFTWGDKDAMAVTDDDFDSIFEENQAFGDYDPLDRDDDEPDNLDWLNDPNYVGSRWHY